MPGINSGLFRTFILRGRFDYEIGPERRRHLESSRDRVAQVTPHFFIYLFTNYSKHQSSSSEDNCSSDTQKISRILRDPEVHNRVHNSLSFLFSSETSPLC